MEWGRSPLLGDGSLSGRDSILRHDRSNYRERIQFLVRTCRCDIPPLRRNRAFRPGGEATGVANPIESGERPLGKRITSLIS